MKRLVLITTALIAFSCTNAKTVEKDGGLVVEVRFTDQTVDDNLKLRTVEALSGRMNAMSVRNTVVELTAGGGGIHIELPEQTDAELFAELAVKPGRFEIVECCPRGDILPVFYEINDKMAAMPEYADTDNPLFSRYLFINSDTFSSDIGFVPPDVADEFETLMDSDWVAALFPRGAKPALMSSFLPENEMYSLFVLKYPANGRAPITGDMIESASVTKNKWGENEIFNVNFRFADQFHAIWARLTRDNIGRNLALVMDGTVYSAPRVNDEIVGGRCQISAGFTMQEAGFIAAILNAGELPAPLSVAHTKVVEAENKAGLSN